MRKSVFNFLRFFKVSTSGLADSTLFDKHMFYDAFIKDLYNCKEEIIIECPFVTTTRASMFIPIFKKILRKEVNIHIITRDPEEIGIDVLLSSGNHHLKLAILDRKILWEGSLNILSQSSSREIMRRIKGKQTAQQIFEFRQLSHFHPLLLVKK